MIHTRSSQPSQDMPRTFVIQPFTATDDLHLIIDAWSRAFADPPNGPRYPEDLGPQLARHMRCANFAGFIARHASSQAILGLIYGYSNHPGDWWRERVAMAMSDDQIATFLDQSFCLTELGVVPAARRQGIAETLVETLVASQPHPYLMLSTRSDNHIGKRFYAHSGWRTLLPGMSFGWNYPPYDILLRAYR